MKLFDSHCHLDDRRYKKDIDEVLKRAENAGVVSAMIVGVTENSSAKAVAIAESHDGLYASVGIHPHDAEECSESVLKFLKDLAGNSKVKAWGETGLDFNRMFSPKDVQEKCFIRQLEVADELKLPMIFHERDSNGRFLDILKTYSSSVRKGVVHCFSGNKTELEEYLKLGFYIGITGILTIKGRGEGLRKLAQIIPVDRILVETDAPYLTPAPEKNKIRRNEPAFVRSTLLKLAEVRGEDPDYLAARVWENTCRLYNINQLPVTSHQ